ncbi:MAG TPA: aldehyde ferredoxin oxidoreductase C-terminal domain-containing protein [Dehalococcoidia bacterium]
MRKYLHINLGDRSVKTDELHGEDIIRAGRYFIARTLLELGAAKVDPLSPDNPLIFSAGPFAGTNFSNANRLSVGCKSPLTGGIKESNSGGTLAFAMGQLEIAGFTLYGALKEWSVIRITKEGAITYESAEPYMGKGNNEAAELLFEKYGKKIAFALCGPVGEYLGLMSGISITDTDGRPSRLAARGGVGAVMGSKKVKAIVAELDKMPTLHDRPKVMSAVREYGKRLRADQTIENFRLFGTASMADYTNLVGGLPVRNFSAGRLTSPDERLKMGGEFIYEQNVARGGEPTHACMPGCLIQCSNVYADADGKEIASPIEYESLCLLGTNCGITDPDDLARLNAAANDLGVDSIETGATLAVLMEAGLAKFGDVDFMFRTLEEIRRGTEKGRLYAQGTARVGKHLGVARVPVIKRQAISAYDPRVIEATGVTMMVSAQGADHTAGNVPRLKTVDLTVDEIVEASMESQVMTAAVDSLGLCVFGRTVTNSSLEMIAEAINAATGTSFDASFFEALGRDTLRLEREFNEAAGFQVGDDELPGFFYAEALPPTKQVARFHAAELSESLDRWWARHS